jgi:hypothetical protein
MKILKKGTVPKLPTREDWVGTKHECIRCNTTFEVETVDDVKPAIGDDGWMWVECPLCGNMKPVSPNRFF